MSDILSEIDFAPQGSLLNENLKTRFYALPPEPDVRAMLETAIREGKLSATESLVAYIRRLYSENEMYAISIAIREGADVNVYITGDESIVGSMHILAYLHMISPKIMKNLFELVTILLVISGSALSKSVFIESVNAIRQENHISQRGETVLEWLTSKSLDSFVRGISSIKSVGEETLHLVGLLLGRLELVDLSGKLNEADAITVIRARSDSRSYIKGDKTIELVDYFPHPSKDVDPRVLVEAIFNFDRKAAKHYIMRGRNLSYPLTNVVLLELLYYARVKTLRHTLGYILLDAVDTGLQFDSDQQTMLAAVGKDIYDHIMKAYSVPHWKKHCAKTIDYTEVIPLKLVRVARSLGFTGTENQLCGFFNNIFMSDRVGLLTALANRQKARIGSRYGVINEFTKVSPPILNVANWSNNSPSPYDIVEDYIVFYRDTDHRTWTWTSENFQFLLKSRRNPSTGKDLPEFILEEIQLKHDSLDDKKPKTWEELLNEILLPDIIDNTESDREILHMVEDLMFHGIPNSFVTGLTALELSSIMCSVRCNYRLDELTDNHALITFAYIYNYYKRNNHLVLEILIISLRNMLNDRLVEHPVSVPVQPVLRNEPYHHLDQPSIVNVGNIYPGSHDFY